MEAGLVRESMADVTGEVGVGGGVNWSNGLEIADILAVPGVSRYHGLIIKVE